VSAFLRTGLALVITLPLVGRIAARAEEPPIFVGAQGCAGCHTAEFDAWKASHHALAMQPVAAATVLGDFAGAQLEVFGVTTTFFRDGEKFMVRTDGPDGALREYPIAYTFGVNPLQQYLIAFSGGRYQALGIAWDSRSKEQGGQRWFHLYPGQKLEPGDRLHWTGRDQTWNYQCADCHSTNLQKNYNLAANTYATTWTDVDVSCEACHGPGSRHVAWANTRAGGGSDDPRMGRTNWLKDADNGRWEMHTETGIARRTEKLASNEIETCSACHSRRKVIAKNPVPGEPYLDAYLPALLEPGLYHADGQIDGEVYEYGSFLQSRMHAAGVTCSNCHHPHSAKLRAEGNALCAQCHLPARFEAREHHHHEPGGAGAQCVNCHMPTKNYMVVDARRDHSIRVPRPRPLGFARNAERLHPASCRPLGGMGGAGGLRVVSEWPADGSAFRDSAARGPKRGSGCRAAARSADSRSELACNRAGQRRASSPAPYYLRLGASLANRDRRPGPARPVGRIARADTLCLTSSHRGGRVAAP
jgi:predicted CXXCH cytochrome family protein